MKKNTKILHPVGNLKIFIIKKAALIINDILLFFLSFFIEIKKSESEIIISNAIFAPWKSDKKFKKIYQKIAQLTFLDQRRLFTLWTISQNLRNINGDILDLGCLKGGAGFLLSKSNNTGNTYLIDTFQGYVDNEKFYKKKFFKYQSLNELKKNIRLLKLKKTIVLKGIFPDDFKKKIKFKKIKICHIDVNTYLSTKKSFHFVDRKIIQGGYIIFDDYGNYGAEGVKKFINEINHKLSKKYHFIFNYQGQCILIKK